MSEFVIETQRLGLRPLLAEDAPVLHEVFTDGYARRFYAHMQDRTSVEDWIRRNQDRYAEHGFGLWAMVLKDEARLVGDCGLVYQDVEGQRELEVAYHVHGSYRRQGFATEAARACLDHGFEVEGRRRLVSMVHTENVASISVAERIHASRQEEPFIHAWAPHWLYYTDREDWEAAREVA